MVKLPLSTLFFDPAAHAAGVEFTSHTLRYVVITRKRRRLQVTSFGSHPLASGIIVNGEVADTRKLSMILRELFPHSARPTVRLFGIFGVLPERHTFLKTLTIGPIPKPQLAEAVRWETSQHIPYETTELALDWKSITPTVQAGQNVLVVTAPRSLPESISEALEGAGFIPLALEPPALSLARAYAHALTGFPIALLLYIDHFESSAVLLEQGTPVFNAAVHTTIAELETKLAQHFNLSSAEAQKTLALVGFSRFRAKGMVRELLQPSFDRLLQRLREIASFYRVHFARSFNLDRVVVCGEGARIAGLAQELTTALGNPVTVASFPPQLFTTQQASGFKSVFPTYSVALGAALRTGGSHA